MVPLSLPIPIVRMVGQSRRRVVELISAAFSPWKERKPEGFMAEWRKNKPASRGKGKYQELKGGARLDLTCE